MKTHYYNITIDLPCISPESELSCDTAAVLGNPLVCENGSKKDDDEVLEKTSTLNM